MIPNYNMCYEGKKQGALREKNMDIAVGQSCQTLCDPMNCSRPGFPVLHYLPFLEKWQQMGRWR